MATIVWITEGTWEAAIDAARRFGPSDTAITIVHVRDDEVAQAAHGSFAGLLGRGHPDRDPGSRVETLGAAAATHLLEDAATRLGKPASTLSLQGRIEREVVRISADADLLICARDGDRTRLGPRSLGPTTRFVVDHAPCPVMLVWPGKTPGIGSIPPPPTVG